MLAGRSALVTGGGRGIGRAISLLLGQLGARVAVDFRYDAQAAEATVEELRRSGSEAVALLADVSIPAQASWLVEQAVAQLGGLDILVVNHGIWKRASLLEMTPEQWRETLRVNLDGAWAICRAAAAQMVPRRSGAIVIVSSTAGQRGEAHHSHYAASKGALLALTKSLAAELAPHGIRVNAVAPGWVLTDMTREVLDGPGGAAAVAPIPRGRAGAPEEIALPVAFLASERASYLYGEVLCVNGGAVMEE